MERGREFFDNMAITWDAKRCTNKRRLDFLVGLAEPPSTGRILDVGTGTGVLIPYLLESGNKNQLMIDAVDFSTGMLTVAREKLAGYDNVRFLCGDILEIDFPEEYYDFIVSLNFFPHLTNLADKELYLKKTYNALKPGGKIVIMHDISRQQVNGVHEHKPETFNDKLPSAHDSGMLLLNAGFSEVVGIEDDYIYFVRGQK